MLIVLSRVDGVVGARLLLLARVEHESRALQIALNCRCHGVRTTEHAPRDPFRVLERRHGLSEIVKRGPVVSVKRLRVKRPHFERQSMSFSESASCHSYLF